MSSEILKLYVPKQYDGYNAPDAGRFLSQCSSWLAKASVTNNKDKFYQALSLLDGRAGAWANGHLEELANGTAPWTSWAAFDTDFCAHFHDVHDDEAAMHEL